MTIGERLVEERKKLHLTQEELGLKLNISRQAISKWESGLCLPDTANLIKLSSLFSCSVDYILRGNEREIENKEETNVSLPYQKIKTKEKHSEKTLMGLPLWSIGYNAKGFFSLGFRSQGVFSLGFISKGICSLGCFSFGGISIGMASLGALSLGTFSVGILSLGAISLALIASLGAISIAPLSLGSLSIGEVSVGAFSRGRWFSYGDDAKGFISIAKTKVSGDYTALLPLKNGEGEYLYSMLKDNIPWHLRWTLGSIKHLLGL